MDADRRSTPWLVVASFHVQSAPDNRRLQHARNNIGTPVMHTSLFVRNTDSIDATIRHSNKAEQKTTKRQLFTPCLKKTVPTYFLLLVCQI